jgi:hypothetical protein
MAICSIEIAKQISNFKNKKEIIPPIKVNDELIDDNKIKCELFNNFVVAQTELDDANVDLPNNLSESECVLNNINITESDVVDLLNILDISKAIRPDGISPCIGKARLKMRYNIMTEQIIINMFKHTSFHDFANDTNQRYRTIIL